MRFSQPLISLGIDKNILLITIGEVADDIATARPRIVSCCTVLHEMQHFYKQYKDCYGKTIVYKD